jgi:hypothetical protein
MYYNMLIESCQKIVENPWLYGFKFDEITEGLRGYRANKHIIFIRYCMMTKFLSLESYISEWI